MFSLMKSNGQCSRTVAEIADEVWGRCTSKQSGLTGDINPVSVLALETAASFGEVRGDMALSGRDLDVGRVAPRDSGWAQDSSEQLGNEDHQVSGLPC
jgi:hypothetical protein